MAYAEIHFRPSLRSLAEATAGHGEKGTGKSLVRKMQYDGAGRTTATYLTDGAGDRPLELGWTDAGSVTNNNVLSQTETQYDQNGNVLLTTQRDRFHDDGIDMLSPHGALGTPLSTTQPKARVSYVANYYDLANRRTDTANLGTNGGMTYMWSTTLPTRSDAVLITHQDYNAAGWVALVTDPRSLKTQTTYDLLGRTIKTVEAYDGGAATNATNKATEYTYDGMNHLLTLQADLPGNAIQQTKYVYGITNPVGSGRINSNDLLAQVLYPDPSSGQPNPNDVETYNYNNLGETTAKTDRNMTIHAYTFDVLSRPTSDAVTIPQFSSVDRTIQQLTTAYDSYGNAYLFTSLDGGGNVKNQVQRTFNGLGQLTAEYQAHSGVVNTSTTPVVQYAYTEMAGGANHSRLKAMTYPNGRQINYLYNLGLDDTISRLSALQNNTGGTILESYAYLGLDTVVQRSHPETGVNLSYINQPGGSTAAGDQYTGLDLFGRVIDQYWATAGGTVTDRFQYGYDRAGNRTYRLNAITHNNPQVPQGFDELYHNGTTAIDTYDTQGNLTNAGYDRLNQLTAFRRGTLTMANTDLTAGSQTRSQDWSLDVMGNWSALTTNGGTPQSRTHNQLNEVTAVGSAHPGFDGNGNTTLDETGKGFVYDAWNRLVRVNGASTPVAYSYDALGRRIQEAETATTDLYFSAQWQVVEEQQGSPATTTAQYVWSPVYVDALIERDAGGQRLYVQQDANWNVTALVNTAGAPVERYVYDPYGQPTFLTPTWTPLAASAYGWIYLHQGGRYDGASGLYNFRNRDLSPTLGRWMQEDPIGFGASDHNLYGYDKENPVTRVDPSGSDSFLIPTSPTWIKKCEEIWVFRF